MQQFLDESGKAGASPNHLRILAELIEREHHWLHNKPADGTTSETEDPF